MLGTIRVLLKREKALPIFYDGFFGDGETILFKKTYPSYYYILVTIVGILCTIMRSLGSLLATNAQPCPWEVSLYAHSNPRSNGHAH
jgi:hypothetical protein